MSELQEFEVYEWEWDCQNGEYIYKDYYPTIIKAKDINEALEIVSKWLEEDVEETDWDCEGIGGDVVNDEEGYVSVVCTKCEEDYCLEHQVGYDVVKRK